MVLEAIDEKGIYTFANSVSRDVQSTIKLPNKFTCVYCNLQLTHVNESKRTIAHFRHPSTDEAKLCKYYSNNDEIPKMYNKREIDTSFVQEWIENQSTPYFCREELCCYTMGSPNGLITVYGEINYTDIQKFKYTRKNAIPHVFILDGNIRKISIFRTDDTCDDWIYFGNKCEVGYILEHNGIVAVDMNCDYIAVISKLSEIPLYYRGTDKASYLYPCELWHIDSFIDEFMPLEYSHKKRRPLNMESFKILKNCKKELERKEKERQEELELRRQEKLEKYRKQKEWEEQIENETKAKNKLIYSKNFQLKVYSPLKINGANDIYKLYTEYITMYNPDELYTRCINYIRETTTDNIEFIHIVDHNLNVPKDKLCSAYAYVVLSEINRFIERYRNLNK